MQKINGNTQLIGLLGWPVSHSFSPAMHNAAAEAAGLNWAYLPLPVHPDDLQTAVSALPAFKFRGVNVTVPHKQAVIPFLDEIGVGAHAIGAVNTIVVSEQDDEAWLVGHNTDWSGFMADLQTLGIEAAGRDCLIIGAGGSARAIAYGLATVGGRVQVLARRVEQAAKLVADLKPYFVDGVLVERPLADLPTIAQSAHAPLIINTTPLGMWPNSSNTPWPDNLPFPKNSTLYDLVYNPRNTRLMEQATAAGCHAVNGLGMLIQQGAFAFKLWTGILPDAEVMRNAIEQG